MAEPTPPSRRVRSRLSAPERRRQILDVTTGLIAARGFWGLSMQDVADGCGLTVPGLLHHVGSKSGLLIAVLRHRDVEDSLSLRAQLGVDGDAVPEEWSAGGPVGVDLRRLCSATMRRNAGQPEIVRLFAVLAAESLTRNHPAHAYFRERQERVVVAFAGLARGVTDRPEQLARHVVALMDGLQVQWLRDPKGRDLVADWEAAAEMVFGAAGSPA